MWHREQRQFVHRLEPMIRHQSMHQMDEPADVVLGGCASAHGVSWLMAVQLVASTSVGWACERLLLVWRLDYFQVKRRMMTRMVFDQPWCYWLSVIRWIGRVMRAVRLLVFCCRCANVPNGPLPVSGVRQRRLDRLTAMIDVIHCRSQPSLSTAHGWQCQDRV